MHGCEGEGHLMVPPKAHTQPAHSPCPPPPHALQQERGAGSSPCELMVEQASFFLLQGEHATCMRAPATHHVFICIKPGNTLK